MLQAENLKKDIISCYLKSFELKFNYTCLSDIVDKGVFDNNPPKTQKYAFRWSMENLKKKLKNPITKVGIDTDAFSIKDRASRGNEMRLAVSMYAHRPDVWTETQVRASLIKKSMSGVQDVTI